MGIEIEKPNEDSGQMIENFKMETCDKLDKGLISTPLKTPGAEQEYERSDNEMKTEPMDSDYEIDSGINSDYDSTDSEREVEKCKKSLQNEKEDLTKERDKLSEDFEELKKEFERKEAELKIKNIENS